MQYEDLKDVFYFKTVRGQSTETFKAVRLDGCAWEVFSDFGIASSIWEYDAMLEYFNDGSWVIQGEEEDADNHTEQKTQQEPTTEIETLRDKFAMVALQGWIAGQPAIAKQPLDGTEDHAKLMAEVAYRYADAMMKARKESL